MLFTLEKERYKRRNASYFSICFGQFVMRYRVAQTGREDATPRSCDPIPIVTCAGQPPPSTNSTLPDVLHLDDGTVMRLLRKPRALDWSPRNDYALLLLFKVPNLMAYFTQSFNIICFSRGGTKRGIWHPSEIQKQPNGKLTFMTLLKKRQE